MSQKSRLSNPNYLSIDDSYAEYNVNEKRVVGARQPKIPNSVADSMGSGNATATINLILKTLRKHGLIES